MEDEAESSRNGGEQEERKEIGRDWADLTPVCLTNVFRRLTLADRWNCAMLVCKSWLDASRDTFLFSTLDLEPSFEAAGGGRDLPSWWTPEFEHRVDSMVRSAGEFGAGNLTEIRVRHCSDLSLSFVAERCMNIQVLSIRSSRNVTDVSLSKIASGCPLLRELDISYCYEISYESLEVIGSKCPNLTVLKRNLLNWLDPSQHSGIVPPEYLNAFPQDADREAAAISKSMPNLKHLELRFSKLMISGLVTISMGCRGLEYLDLFGCANLTGRAIDQASTNLQNLKTLRKPNFYIPRSVFHTERYGHWRLYDERFQTNVFQI